MWLLLFLDSGGDGDGVGVEEMGVGGDKIVTCSRTSAIKSCPQKQA